MARIKFVDVADLIPQKPKERKLSPRQLAALKREAEYEKAIAKLEGSKVAVFEATEEKLPTLRASLTRVIARSERKDQLHFAMKGGVAYVSLQLIPGARARRKRTSA